MTKLTTVSLILIASLEIPFALAQTSSAANTPAKVEVWTVENGSATFYVPTNIPAIEVKGKSGALQAHVQLHRDAAGVVIDRIDAIMPIASLVTGMAVRDEHMRKHIFTTANGDIPDMQFESQQIACPGLTSGHEVNCNVNGNLKIRGVAHAFSIALRVRQNPTGPTIHATGGAVIKLSDYGIEQPSQLGVKTANEVQVHLEFTGRENALVTTAKEGR